MGAIGATGANRIIVTHGSIPVMVRYLASQGLQAEAFETAYGDETAEEKEEKEEEKAVPLLQSQRA